MMTKKIGVLTIDEIASQMDVHRGTVYQWVNRGCPRGPIQDVRDWYEVNVNAQPTSSELNDELKRVEIEKMREEIRYKRLKCDQIEGRLISKEEVHRDLSLVFGAMRNRLKSLGASVAIYVNDGSKGIVKQRVEKEVAESLRILADEIRNLRLLQDEEGQGPNMEAGTTVPAVASA